MNTEKTYRQQHLDGDFSNEDYKVIESIGHAISRFLHRQSNEWLAEMLFDAAPNQDELELTLIQHLIEDAMDVSQWLKVRHWDFFRCAFWHAWAELHNVDIYQTLEKGAVIYKTA